MYHLYNKFFIHFSSVAKFALLLRTSTFSSMNED